MTNDDKQNQVQVIIRCHFSFISMANEKQTEGTVYSSKIFDSLFLMLSKMFYNS